MRLKLKILKDFLAAVVELVQRRAEIQVLLEPDFSRRWQNF